MGVGQRFAGDTYMLTRVATYMPTQVVANDALAAILPPASTAVGWLLHRGPIYKSLFWALHDTTSLAHGTHARKSM